MLPYIYRLTKEKSKDKKKRKYKNLQINFFFFFCKETVIWNKKTIWKVDKKNLNNFYTTVFSVISERRKVLTSYEPCTKLADRKGFM